MHKSLASNFSLKRSFLPVANLLLVPVISSTALAAPSGTSASAVSTSESAITLPAPASLPKPASTTPQTSTSRKLAVTTLPQGTLHRDVASTIVSTTAKRVDVQKASTRIALQSSLPIAQPRIVQSKTSKARVASAKVVKASTAAPLNATLFAPSAATPKVVESKVEVSAKAEAKPKILIVTRLATLPKEVKAAEKKASPVVRRAQPTVLASRSMMAPDASDDLALLSQLERELKVSRTQLRRANAHLSEGQRELQKFNGVLRAAMLEAGADAKGLHPFVKVAQRYAGTPYVWGGESARGFDCSGFIIRVMRDLGYKALPHSAAEQFKYGMPVAQPLLKPGDLVFFANTYKPGISHVGIYLGKRRFIHAAGTGLGTIVSNLDSPKYQAKYAGARRLVAAR